MRLNIPAAKRTYELEYPTLVGGLNLRELEYRLQPNESPFMKNMWWQNGVLQSRYGQKRLSERTDMGVGYTCYRSLFYGYAFFHIGDGIYYAQAGGETMELTKLEIPDGVPQNKGSFFCYREWLFYKNTGGYFRISYQPGSAVKFKGESVGKESYTPRVFLFTDRKTGVGDKFQPENRLSRKVRVEYRPITEADLAGGSRMRFLLPGGTDSAETSGEPVCVSIDSVTKNGRSLPDGAVVDKKPTQGSFTIETSVAKLRIGDVVEVTFTKRETGDTRKAYQAILDCNIALVSGGEQELCIVLAGAKAQPNAVFWNANDSQAMNPFYFPFPNYNLVGDSEDPVTGLGQQFRDTMVFKKHSVGKLTFGYEKVDGRDAPAFVYTNINDRIGCDLPGTIQLVDNNLVFCNTYQGVHLILSSSAALENNIVAISLKVNDPSGEAAVGDTIPGLLSDVRAGGWVSSWNDDSRYWLCANGHAYLWDFTISGYKEPSWFYMTNIRPLCFFSDYEHRGHHMDSKGRITRFGRYYSDYGEAIDKVYQFPVTNFGTYEALKDVPSITLAVKNDVRSRVKLRYDTDYETRYDETDIQSWVWAFAPRNLIATVLGYYNTGPTRFATVARRRTGCRHIRHFTMTLSNNRPGEDMSIVSARVLYRIQQKER